MAFKMKAGSEGPFRKNFPSAFKKEINYLDDKTNPKPKPKVSYADAYKKRDMKTYGSLSQEEYITEAKRQAGIYKETGKWDYKNAPKKETVKDTSRTTKTKLTTADNTKTVKTVKDNAGTVRKIKTKTEDDVFGTIKTKEKFNKGGDRTKKKVTTKTDDTVTKLKIKDKKDKPAKVKTRKKGGTGIGAAIKQKLSERKKRRDERKEDAPFKNYKKGYYGEGDSPMNKRGRTSPVKPPKPNKKGGKSGLSNTNYLGNIFGGGGF